MHEIAQSYDAYDDEYDEEVDSEPDPPVDPPPVIIEFGQNLTQITFGSLDLLLHFFCFLQHPQRFPRLPFGLSRTRMIKRPGKFDERLEDVELKRKLTPSCFNEE